LIIAKTSHYSPEVNGFIVDSIAHECWKKLTSMISAYIDSFLIRQ